MRASRVCRGAFAVWVLAIGGVLSCTSAAAANVRIESVRVGFDNICMVGRWVPIEVDLSGDGGETLSLQVQTFDPDGNAVVFPLPPAVSTGAGLARGEGIICVGRIDRAIRVEARSGERVVASYELPAAADQQSGPIFLRQSTELWLTVGAQPAFQQAADRRNEQLGRLGASTLQIACVSLDNSSLFPRRAAGLDSVDVVAVDGDYRFDAAQSAALEQWVESGGRLILAAGETAADYSSSPLASWVPSSISGTRRVRELNALGARLPDGGPIAIERDVAVADWQISGGRVLAQDQVGPLIIRTPHGSGTITLVAVNLNRPPISHWESLPDLALLLGSAPAPPSALDVRPDNELAPTGVSDLATQWIAAVDDYPQVRRTSTWGVLGYLLIYLAVIGPLDYFLVHRVLQRPQWTWVTFPLWVVIGGVAGTALAANSNGDQNRTRQVDVVDVYADSGRVLSRSWFSLYTAESRRYGVEASAAATWSSGGPQPLMSWVGAPEESFRGMYRSGGLQLAIPTYHFEESLDGIRDLPVNVWSTKLLAAQWSRPAADEALVESRLIDDGTGRLTGTLTHRLPAGIEDWFIAYGNAIYLPIAADEAGPRPIAAGRTFLIEESAQPRLLKGALTGVRYRTLSRKGTMGADIVANRTAYDPFSRDLYDILQIISFHAAAGGKDYTSLDHHVLARMDLSTAAALKRAVIFGRIDSSPTSFSIDGKPIASEEGATFVRVVLPVERGVAGE